MTLLMDHNPKSRKHHRCTDCGGWIVPGEVYRSTRIENDGTVYTWKQHLDCFAMSQENVAKGYAPDYWYDGIPPLREDDGIIEELDQWRGKYPHVVCRIEYGRQISELKWQDRLTQKDPTP